MQFTFEAHIGIRIVPFTDETKARKAVIDYGRGAVVQFIQDHDGRKRTVSMKSYDRTNGWKPVKLFD